MVIKPRGGITVPVGNENAPPFVPPSIPPIDQQLISTGSHGLVLYSSINSEPKLGVELYID